AQEVGKTRARRSRAEAMPKHCRCEGGRRRAKAAGNYNRLLLGIAYHRPVRRMAMKLAMRVLLGTGVGIGLLIAPGTAFAQDARAVVQAAATAMGANNLKTIQMTGAGWTAAVGQSYNLTTDWPRFEVPAYTKVIDYDAKSSREEYTRRQGNYPPVGGGFTPLPGEPRTIALSSGNYAWNLEGTTVVPQPGTYLAGIPIAELRQLDIVLTPHGFLKAAL